MEDGKIQIASIGCSLSDLISFTENPAVPETILRVDESFGLAVTVQLSRAGSIALLALHPLIHVEFVAKSFDHDKTIPLGTVTVDTSAQQLLYQPTLTLENGPVSLGLHPDILYHITAILRVGATNAPALITGFIQGLVLQIYTLD